MEWNRNVNEIPPRTTVLVLTDLGEVLLAWRSRKNGRNLDIKCAINGKIEWSKNEESLKSIVYWCRIPNLTKAQYDSVFDPLHRWNKMFEL